MQSEEVSKRRTPEGNRPCVEACITALSGGLFHNCGIASVHPVLWWSRYVLLIAIVPLIVPTQNGEIWFAIHLGLSFLIPSNSRE